MPYDRVANEIIHWCGSQRKEYDAILNDQLRMGDAATELRSLIRSKKLIRPDNVSTPYHELALQQLKQNGEWKRDLVKYESSTECTAPAGEIRSKLNPDWSAEGVLIRASEGSRALGNLKEYTPYFQDLSFPDIPEGVSANDAAREYVDDWKGREQKKLNKKRAKAIKGDYKNKNALEEDPQYTVSEAEAENMYQNIARYYRYIKDADAQAEALNASLSKEKISGFLKELFGILDTEN
jgi:hypothetical protein